MSVHSEKVNFRIDPELKLSAEAVFSAIGLSMGEACRMFFKQVTLQKGLPFQAKIPNSTTLDSMKDAELGKVEKFANLDDMFASWKNQ